MDWEKEKRIDHLPNVIIAKNLDFNVLLSKRDLLTRILFVLDNVVHLKEIKENLDVVKFGVTCCGIIVPLF